MEPVRNPVLNRLDIPAQLNHHQQDLQLQDHKNIPDVTVEAGKPFIINLPSQTSMAEVTGRDGKPLPPWIVYDATSQTVRGQPASSDAGDWAVRVDGPAREVFTIRVRRQVMDDDDANEGSGSLIDDYSESDDVESDVNEEIVSPDNRVVISPTTPLFNGPSVLATPVMEPIPSTKAKNKNPTNPSNRMTAIEPTLNRQIEPTPVQVMEGTTVRVLDDYSNSSLFDRIEETQSSEETPPLTDDLEFLGPNSISDYDEEQAKNSPIPPSVTMRLPKIPATAGKVFRFVIPVTTFSDPVDGSSANLHLELLSEDGKPLDGITWIGFNATKREIYGLPLADDIGKYSFLVRARNSANLTVTETAEIQVRQHPSERAFHHQFTLQLEPEFSEDEETLPQVYWMLKTVAGLSRTVGDKEDFIVVRRINGTVKNGHAFTFTWSNESLPRTHCPEDEIHESFDLIYNRVADQVTDQLDTELAPQLSVTLGSVELDGICQPLPVNPPPSIPQKETKPSSKMNQAPTTRNQVDHLSAEVGVLFRYPVPADTFHDEEDGDTRMLKLSLQNMNRQPLDSRNWLQFDSPNQEFYGLPLDNDVGSEEYQLLCTDSSGAVESDGLVVVVKERSKKPEDQPLVEFSLTIDDNYDTLMGKASRKVRLIEALAQIFNDPNHSNIIIRSFTSGSTVVTWSNATLIGTECPPNSVIENLRRMLMDDEGKLTQRSTEILVAADFQPSSAQVSPLGNCVGQHTPTFAPGADDGKTEGVDGQSTDDAWSDDYLLTFIVPGIIITVMLLLAAVIACILYRRRRTGKLGLEERRSFVSKGIPIIFAEELEERPSGRHPAKAPVILKEEKPSQPPDYHKVRSSASPYASHKAAEQHDLLRTPSDDAEEEPNSLYQPPPPLSAGRDSSSRYSRPKATPAYRKPPPYVPP